MLEDYRHLMTDRRGEQNFYSSDDIRKCMRKVVPVALHESVAVEGSGLVLTPYYAGHVLGACMFMVEVAGEAQGQGEG